MGLIESCKKATRDPAVLMVSGFALEKCPEAVSAASLTNERQEIDGSADTHWAVCTDSPRQRLPLLGTQEPGATASSSQRLAEVPFQSQRGGWRGGFTGLCPNTDK